MVEEEELSLRALSKGAKILLIDLLRIRHEVTDTSRNRRGITLRCFRNWFLLWMMHAPFVAIPWRVLRLFLSGTQMAIRQCDFASIQGIFAGIKTLPSLWRLRTPVSMDCYRRFRLLPHSLDFFGKK
jgi:hypothetical protein